MVAIYNHAWTLFVNRTYDGTEPLVPGGVAVPRGYRRVAPGGPDGAIRAAVFGADPDLDMLAYRARQFFRVWHAGPLAKYVTLYDSRVAYDPADPAAADPAVYRPRFRPWPGTPVSKPIYAVGTPAAPDASGRLFREYAVAVAGSTVTVGPRFGRPADVAYTPALDGGLTEPLPLPGSGYSVLVDATEAARWSVGVSLRPTRTLADVVALVDATTSTAVLAAIDALAEPVRDDVRDAWAGDVVPDRAAAVAVLLVALTEERRRAGH